MDENKEPKACLSYAHCPTAHRKKHSKSGEIDLHGLYVKEALERTEYAIQDAKADGTVRRALDSGGSANAKVAP